MGRVGQGDVGYQGLGEGPRVLLVELEGRLRILERFLHLVLAGFVSLGGLEGRGEVRLGRARGTAGVELGVARVILVRQDLEEGCSMMSY